MSHRDTSSAETARDDQRFLGLIMECERAGYALAYQFLRCPQAAQDAAQEAVIRAFRARERFDGNNVRPWFMRIVANASRDELRRRRRHPAQSLDAPAREGEVALEAPDPTPTPEVAVLHAELRVALERALLDLPDALRAIVVLRDVHGLAYEEIAGHLGIPVGTVRSRLSRARGRLRAALLAAGVVPGGATAAWGDSEEGRE